MVSARLVRKRRQLRLAELLYDPDRRAPPQKVILKLLDSPRKRGLFDMEAFGDPREVQLFGQDTETAQMAQFHRSAPIMRPGLQRGLTRLRASTGDRRRFSHCTRTPSTATAPALLAKAPAGHC